MHLSSSFNYRMKLLHPKTFNTSKIDEFSKFYVYGSINIFDIPDNEPFVKPIKKHANIFLL